MRKKKNLVPCPHNIGLLSGSLCKDPKIARLHLRRSKSFHNLDLAHHLQSLHQLGSLPHHHASLSLRRAHSCPDLSGIHLMHPQLHGRVMSSTTDKLQMSKKNILFSSLSPKDEVPVGLHKCKTFILDYWTDTVPSTISEDL